MLAGASRSILTAAAEGSRSDDALREEITALKQHAALVSTSAADEPAAAGRRQHRSIPSVPSDPSPCYEYRYPVREAEDLAVPHLRTMLGLPSREPLSLVWIEEDYRKRKGRASSSRPSASPGINRRHKPDRKLLLNQQQQQQQQQQHTQQQQQQQQQQGQPWADDELMAKALEECGLRDVECSWDGITRLSPIPIHERSMSLREQRKCCARLTGIEEVHPNALDCTVGKRVPKMDACLGDDSTPSLALGSTAIPKSTRSTNSGGGGGGGSVSTVAPFHVSRPSSAASSMLPPRHTTATVMKFPPVVGWAGPQLGNPRPSSAPTEERSKCFPRRSRDGDLSRTESASSSSSSSSVIMDSVISCGGREVPIGCDCNSKVVSSLSRMRFRSVSASDAGPAAHDQPSSHGSIDGNGMVSAIIGKALTLKRSQAWDKYPPTVHTAVYGIIEDSLICHRLYDPPPCHVLPTYYYCRASLPCRATASCHAAMHVLQKEMPRMAERVRAVGLTPHQNMRRRVVDGEPHKGGSMQRCYEDISSLVDVLQGPSADRLDGHSAATRKVVNPGSSLSMLEYKMKLVECGVDHVVLAVGFQPEHMQHALKEMEAKYKVKITCSIETEPLGTAGPLYLARDVLLSDDEPVFVFNSDVICDFPLKELLAFHTNHGREGTIVVTKVEDPSRFGVVVYDEETGKIDRFVEKPKEFVGDKINAGLYILSNSVIEKRVEPRFMMVETDVFPQMAVEGELYCFQLQG
ncbi:hypothetical protein FOZ62_016928, partial [Perkinsus olseni]